tara:strand:+ start:15084 stop:16472 length:1389 start_codon:yes stop_codon:yes gene_type:complete
MKLRVLQHIYLVSSLASSVIAALAGSSVCAQESVELEESVRSRSSFLFIDTPILVKEGVDPIMPLRRKAPPIDPESDPAFGQRMDSIRQYNSTVEDIERDGGAWDGGLVEELASLGRLQQQQGDHSAAIETLDRAIHVNRINSGLNTLEQVPVVERLIQSQMALGNWGQVDTYTNYLFHVQQKAYGFDDPRFIPVIERLATWNIQAFNISYGDLRGVRLRESLLLFNMAVRMVGMHFGKADPRFVNFQKIIVNSSYLIGSNPELLMEINDPENRNRQEKFAEKMHVPRRVETSGFRSGERALIEIATFYQEQSEDPYVLAEAITHLADWYLIFDQTRDALKRYKIAWDILQDLENSEELTERLFGDVVPVPLFTSSIELPDAFYRNGDGSGPLEFDYADLIFDVTSKGEVRNVEIVSEETEDNRQRLSKLRRVALSSRFRPRIVDGVPQSSSGHHFRYRYWY